MPSSLDRGSFSVIGSSGVERSLQMRIIWSPISFRLIGGFLVILMIFAVAALLSMRYIQRIAAATDEIRRLEQALSAALRMQSLANRQSAAQADLMVGEDYQRMEDFRNAVAQMARQRREIATLLDSQEERDLLEQCRIVQEEVERLFQYQFIPALASNDIQQMHALRRESREAIARLIGLCTRLRLDLSAKINRATARALTLQDAAIRNSGLLLAAAVVGAVLVSLMAARSVVQPILKLIEGTEAVSLGNLDRRIELPPRRDEIGQLAESFNRMTEQLRNHQRQLVQAEKMASLGQLAAGVAHEINNPIGVILGYARVILQDPALPPDLRKDMKAIEEEALQCKRIVQDLLDLSRPMSAAEEIVDIGEMIGEVIERARAQCGESQISFIWEPSCSQLLVRGDRSKLRQAVQNIVQNAIEAMQPHPGTLTITCSRQRGPAGRLPTTPEQASAEFITLEFHDTGCGIAPEHLGRLFDPFFSTKSNGTGLGLSITYSIVRAHGGFIDVRSTLGKGSTFIVNLPAHVGREREKGDKEWV